MERNFRLPTVLSSPHKRRRNGPARSYKAVLDERGNGSDEGPSGIRIKSLRHSLEKLASNIKFRVTTRKRKIVPKEFFDDCDKILAKQYASKFFDDLDGIRDTLIREVEQAERYKARRAANIAKSERVLNRFRKVQSMDLFAMTQHIEPDWFGDKQFQFEAVKELHKKKTRLMWFLKGLYVYLAFDQEVDGWSAKRGFRYSRHRAYHAKVMENHKEKLRQEKWDLKKAKVRKRRKQLQEKGMSPQEVALYALRRGLGNNVPLPAPVLEVEKPEIPSEIKQAVIWDD
jgi:hypothetical protein